MDDASPHDDSTDDAARQPPATTSTQAVRDDELARCAADHASAEAAR